MSAEWDFSSLQPKMLFLWEGVPPGTAQEEGLDGSLICVFKEQLAGKLQ